MVHEPPTVAALEAICLGNKMDGVAMSNAWTVASLKNAADTISVNEMGVSKNNGTPKIIHVNRVFHYKPSMLGYPYFWKHLYK